MNGILDELVYTRDITAPGVIHLKVLLDTNFIYFFSFVTKLISFLEGIRLKLTSAQKDDKPRWGDYPEKLDLKYIEGLIRDGGWFDGSKPFYRAASVNDDPQYAPPYVLRNKEQFAHLLSPPAAKT